MENESEDPTGGAPSPIGATAWPPGIVPPPEPGRTFRLPNGVVLDLSEWMSESFRSAFFVEPYTLDKEWELFTYGRGAPIPGTDRTATRALTNLPRSGDSGLPRGWEMYVLQWRAMVNMPLEQPILDWASETSVQFEYNSKFYGQTTLLDLLLGARAIGDPMPIHVRENLGFRAAVTTDNEKAVETLRTWLRGSAIADSVREAATELDTIIRMQSDENVRAALRHVQAKLQPGRVLTAWVHLEGPIKRVIL